MLPWAERGLFGTSGAAARRKRWVSAPLDVAFGTDYSYQNLSEFIGAILAVMGQVMLGLSGQRLALRGDSVTALTWAVTERPRGDIVTNAAMVWTLLCVAVIHIPGDDNVKCDRLSRRGSKPVLAVKQEDGFIRIESGGDGQSCGRNRNPQAVRPEDFVEVGVRIDYVLIRASSAISDFVAVLGLYPIRPI
jgi:hypothetical protein